MSDPQRILSISSDENNCVYCEPCQKDGPPSISLRYCVGCSEYLCTSCYRNHTRYKAMENHVLKDVKDSLLLEADTGLLTQESIKETCNNHPAERVEYFCERCDQLGCNTCMRVYHSHCERTEFVPLLTKRQKYKEELNAFDKFRNGIAEKLAENEDNISFNIALNSELKTLAQEVVKKQRDKINKFFDELEEEINRKVSQIDKSNSTQLTFASDRINTLQREFERINSEIEEKKAGQTSEMFIAMIRHKHKMKTFEEELDKLSSKRRIQRYTVVPSEEIEVLMRNTREMCRVTTARLESEIDINSDDDEEKPRICGLAVMHEHFCVTTDDSNTSLKVIDTRSKRVASQIKLDAAYLNNDVVAVSLVLPDLKVNQLQFFTVSVSGVINSSAKPINTVAPYYDLTSGKDYIFACASEEIHQIGRTGKRIRCFKNDEGVSIGGIVVSDDSSRILLQ